MADFHSPAPGARPAPTSAAPPSSADPSLLPFAGRGSAGWEKRTLGAPIPDRYEIRAGDDGRHLTCDEAPRVRVSIEREHTFSETAARALGERTILLDGAGCFGPMLDKKSQLYNLDHHQGCLRAFTLATCEQALLLVNTGLALGEGDWTVYANEPDLDTVLAIWCLLNYQRLQQLRPAAREVLVPPFRLEGAIDANGIELAEWCGLPAQILEQTQRRIDHLIGREREVKARGAWQSVDFLSFTAELLREIDRMIYAPADFSDYTRLEELYGHVQIGDGRYVAVACRDSAGIYDVERLLRKRWGDQLGVVALEKEPRHFTLRLSAPLADIDLEHAYQKLNLLDPAVDGRPPEKRWGGSDNIGGSPRPGGTALAPLELLHALGSAYRQPSRRVQVSHAALGLALALVLVLLGQLADAALALVGSLHLSAGLHSAVRLATASSAVALASLLLARWLSGRRLWLFGVRRPAGLGWLVFAPVALLAALPLGVIAPPTHELAPLSLVAIVGAAALAAVASELCFRGLVHGQLLLHSRPAAPGISFRISAAALWSSLVYAAVVLALSVPAALVHPLPLLERSIEIAAFAGFALLGGLALAGIRERSQSLWPCALVQLAGAIGAGALWRWLGTAT
jgi:hypothetical protein